MTCVFEGLGLSVSGLLCVRDVQQMHIWVVHNNGFGTGKAKGTIFCGCALEKKNTYSERHILST